MARILFAWELGGNLGHMARDLPLARTFRQAGHDVVIAVPRIKEGLAFFTQEKFTLVQAPLLRPNLRQAIPQINYAGMLLHEGYEDENALESAVLKWEKLYELTSPSLVIYNHAPTALIAARAANIPMRLIGTGFEIPPCVSPLPSFRPWEKISAEQLQRVEDHCVNKINTCLAKRGAKKIDKLSELFYAHEITLTTFPELDPFGPRKEVVYLGSRYIAPATAKTTSWEMDDRPHVFAYLRPTVPGCEQLLMALQGLGVEAICVVPDMPQDWPQNFNKLRFFSDPVDLSSLLPQADLVVTYGATTIPTALLAGVPVMVVPQVIEQHLSGAVLEAMGAGLMLKQNRTEACCIRYLKHLLEDNQYRTAANIFASKYAASTATQNMRDMYEFLLGSFIEHG